MSVVPAAPHGRWEVTLAQEPEAGLEGQPAERADREEPVDRDALFAEFQPLVRRLIRQYGDDADLRDDLVGEMYFRFCGLLDAYDPSRNVPLRAYLVRQLCAAAYTVARKQRRLQLRQVSLVLDAVSMPQLATPNPTAEWDQRLLMESLTESLPAAIAELSARQRQVLVWRYYESRSFDEIAEELNVRPATVRSLLRHAINSVRARLLPEEMGK